MNIKNNSLASIKDKNQNITNVVRDQHQANLYVNYLDSELCFNNENSPYPKTEEKEGLANNADYQNYLDKKTDDPNNCSNPNLND